MAEFLGLSHTLMIILITILISIYAWNNQTFFSRLILWSPAIKQHQYERFISYGFVHADVWHLFFNMITLFFFGHLIERLYTPFLSGLGFILFYLGGLVFSCLPSYFRHKHNPYWATVGASGAISAILFTFVLLLPWEIIYFFFIPVPAIIFAILYIAYSIWADRRQADTTNHSAHLWGAAYGVITAIIIEPQVLTHFIHALLNPKF